MIEKILHIADIHIRSSIEYHEFLKFSLQNIVEVAAKYHPDRIVIVGDLFHDYTNISNEAMKIAHDFILDLSNVSPVILTCGNHDINLTSTDRMDSIKVLHHMITGNTVNDIRYYNSNGIYYDENIAWVTYHHPDKNIDIELPSDRKHTYIGLFHDPVKEALTFGSDKQFFDDGNYNSIWDFGVDYLLMGDIHKKQIFLNKDNTPYAAYSSSPICQNYSESDEFHGVLLWNINSGTIDKIPIIHHIVFKVIEVTGNNYKNILENLALDSNFHYRFKIKLYDYADTDLLDIKSYIKSYLRDKFIVKELIIQTKQNNSQIKSISAFNRLDSSFVIKNEAESILDKSLSDDVIKLDNDINNLVEVNPDLINWSLNSISFFNFRSYPDEEITIKFENGITELFGENQSGKTNIFNSITYLLYGKTYLSKKVKYLDLKFINHNNDIDYCYVNGEFTINGNNIFIERRTEIKRKLNGEIKSVSTKCNIDNNQMIEYFGTLDDFIHNCYVNSDNLNEALSMDNRNFKDRLIIDLGLSIFERKHKKASELKRKFIDTNGLIKIDLSKFLSNLKDIKLLIHLNEKKLSDIENQIEQYSGELEGLTKQHVSLVKSLNDLPDGMESVDKLLSIKADLLFKKSKYENTFSKIKKSIDNINREKTEEISSYRTSINELNSSINRYQIAIEEKEQLIEELNGNYKATEDIVDPLPSLMNQINDTESKILKLNVEISNLNSDYQKQLSEFQNVKNIKDTKLDAIKSKQKNISDQISDTESFIKTIIDSECEECGHINKGQQHELDRYEAIVRNLKDDLSESLDKEKSIFETSINEPPNEESYRQTSDLLVSRKIDLENFLSDIRKKYEEQSKVVFDKKKSLLEIQSKIKSLTDDIQNSILLIAKYEERKKSFHDKINHIDEIFEERSKTYSESLINHQNSINSVNDKLLKLKLVSEKISENNKIEIEISECVTNINRLKKQISDLSSEKNPIVSDLIKFRIDHESLSKKIKEFKKQQDKLLVYQTYMDLVGRDGIPNQIIKSMLNGLTLEFNSMLSDQSFGVLFDDMNLLMYNNNNPDFNYSVLDGSGKERTIISLIFRYLMRNFNKKFKCNLLLIDEILGKLSTTGVEQFKDILTIISKKIPNILIVEHSHNIGADNIIKVSKPDSYSIIETS